MENLIRRLASSDLVLHCLPMSHKKDSIGLIWVKKGHKMPHNRTASNYTSENLKKLVFPGPSSVLIFTILVSLCLIATLLYQRMNVIYFFLISASAIKYSGFTSLVNFTWV